MKDPFAQIETTADESDDPFASIESASKEAPPLNTQASPSDVFSAIEAPAPTAQPTSVWGAVKEIPGKLWEDFKQRPNFASEAVTDDEIQDIATKYGVDAEQVRKMVPLYGGKTESNRDYLREAEGVISESALLGIPTAITRKLAPDNEQAAMDALNELTEAKKSKAQFGAEVLMPGAGNVAAKGLKGVGLATGIGAAQGLSESKEGDELQSTLLGGTIGAVAGSAGEGIRHVFSKPKAASALSDAIEPEGRGLMEGIRKARQTDLAGDAEVVSLLDKSPVEGKDLQLPKEADLSKYAEARNVPLSRAPAEFEQEVREFGRMIRSAKAKDPNASLPSLDEARGLIRDMKLSQGVEELGRRFEEYRVAKKAQELYADAVDTKVRLQTGNNPVRQAVEFIIDGTHAARAMDTRLGTSVERVLTDMSQANNLYTRDLDSSIRDLRKLDEVFRASKLSDDEFYRRMDSGDFSGLTPEQLQATQAFKQKFKQMGESLQKLGVPLQMRENYVPRQMVPFVDAILRVEKKAEALGKEGVAQFAELDAKELAALRKANPTVDDVVRGVEAINHAEVLTGRQLAEEFTLAMNPATAGARSEMTAGAAMQRLERIPEFLLEKNPAKLVSSWASQNFKAARFQPGLSELRKLRNVAHAAGELQDAAYLQKLITDLSGRRSDTVAAWINTLRDKKLLEYKRLAANSTGNQKAFYEFLTETPDFVGSLYNQIYTNVLGLKPRAAVQNLLQPFLVTIPELGSRYGTLKVAKAYANTLARLSDSKSSIKLAEEAGMIPIQFSTELRDAVKGGIRQNAAMNFTEKQLNRFSSVAMFLFEKSEQINRAVTYELGKDVANDLMTKSAMAQGYLNSVPSEFRRAIQEAVSSGNQKETERLVTNYLMNRTQFNYNRITMNEMGRALGPLFSTFSKWPVTIAGDVYTTYLRMGGGKGTTELLRKYYGPAFAAAALSTYIFGQKESRYEDTGEENKMDALLRGVLPGATQQSERQKVAERLFFGTGSGLARGIGGGAPLQSLESAATGKIFAAPAVQMVMKPVQAAITGDEKAIDAFTKSVASTFIPVYGPMSKFWTETLPAMSTAAGLSSENPYAK